MRTLLCWIGSIGKPVILVVVLCLIMFKLMDHYSLPVALGLISLAMTVLSGTDFVRNNIQYINPPNGKTYDIWGLSSISVGVFAVIRGIQENQIEGSDASAYKVLLGILFLIMILSAIFKKNNSI
jgi:hypothetical protein